MKLTLHWRVFKTHMRVEKKTFHSHMQCARRKIPPEKIHALKKSSEQAFLNNFCHHREAGRSCGNLFEKVRVNAVLFLVFLDLRKGFWSLNTGTACMSECLLKMLASISGFACRPPCKKRMQPMTQQSLRSRRCSD